MKKKNPPMWAFVLILGILIFPFCGVVYSGTQSAGLHEALVAKIAKEEGIVTDAQVAAVQDGVPILQAEGAPPESVSVLGDYESAMGSEVEVSYLGLGEGYYVLDGVPGFLLKSLPLLIPVLLVMFVFLWEHGPIHMATDERKRIRIGLSRKGWWSFLWRFLISLCALAAVLVAAGPIFSGSMADLVDSVWIKRDFPFFYGVFCIFLGMLLVAAYEIPESDTWKKIRTRIPIVPSWVAIAVLVVSFLAFTTSSMIQSVREGSGDSIQGRAEVAAMDCADSAGRCTDAVLLEYSHEGIEYFTWAADYPDGVEVGDSLPIEWNSHRPWVVDFVE